MVKPGGGLCPGQVRPGGGAKLGGTGGGALVSCWVSLESNGHSLAPLFCSAADVSVGNDLLRGM